MSEAGATGKGQRRHSQGQAAASAAPADGQTNCVPVCVSGPAPGKQLFLERMNQASLGAVRQQGEERLC